MKFIQIDEYIENSEIKLEGPLHITKVEDSLVEKLKNRFLDLFAQCGLINEVCRQMGISSGTVYHWRRHDSAFAEEWDRIRRVELLAIIEDKAFERVMDGDKNSDGLMMFLMKSYSRKTYDDKFVENEKEKRSINFKITDAREVAKEETKVLELEAVNGSTRVWEPKKTTNTEK